MPRHISAPVIIDSENTLQKGAEALALADPVLARLLAGGATPPMRGMEAGFSGLCRIITGQQLSTASANAIWRRVADHFGEITPANLTAETDEAIRGLGMSSGKIRTLRAVAEAAMSGNLPLDTFHEKPAQEAHDLMTAVHGIGPWTADIYLMFCIGHADVFPAGDLALQEAVKAAYDLKERPKVGALAEFSGQWRPWRSVAARILWAHYRQLKSREGILTGS